MASRGEIITEAVRALALLDRIDAASFARAVRGELVLQDLAGEPPAVLLTHLAAAHSPAFPKLCRAA